MCETHVLGGRWQSAVDSFGFDLRPKFEDASEARFPRLSPGTALEPWAGHPHIQIRILRTCLSLRYVHTAERCGRQYRQQGIWSIDKGPSIDLGQKTTKEIKPVWMVEKELQPPTFMPSPEIETALLKPRYSADRPRPTVEATRKGEREHCIWWRIEKLSRSSGVWETRGVKERNGLEEGAKTSQPDLRWRTHARTHSK